MFTYTIKEDKDNKSYDSIIEKRGEVAKEFTIHEVLDQRDDLEKAVLEAEGNLHVVTHEMTGAESRYDCIKKVAEMSDEDKLLIFVYAQKVEAKKKLEKSLEIYKDALEKIRLEVEEIQKQTGIELPTKSPFITEEVPTKIKKAKSKK